MESSSRATDTFSTLVRSQECSARSLVFFARCAFWLSRVDIKSVARTPRRAVERLSERRFSRLAVAYERPCLQGEFGTGLLVSCQVERL